MENAVQELEGSRGRRNCSRSTNREDTKKQRSTVKNENESPGFGMLQAVLSSFCLLHVLICLLARNGENPTLIFAKILVFHHCFLNTLTLHASSSQLNHVKLAPKTRLCQSLTCCNTFICNIFRSAQVGENCVLFCHGEKVFGASWSCFKRGNL